jgi:hypothetical protein
MSNFRCVVADCRHHDALRDECRFARERDAPYLRCESGTFRTLLRDRLGDLGEWRVREYKDGPIRATLRGRLGTVEVWGGRNHAPEAWFVERGTKAETQMDAAGGLRDAVERACAMAGVQARLGMA